MTEPKRLTKEELVEIRKPYRESPLMRQSNNERAFREREALLAHVAAQEAEIAELKAENDGLRVVETSRKLNIPKRPYKKKSEADLAEFIDKHGREDV